MFYLMIAILGSLIQPSVSKNNINTDKDWDEN